MRTGIGFDVHAFAPDRKLILGGVEIPHHQGLMGHSDADVLTHAIMDALLGAARLGDIGKLFPDTDQQFKGIDSMILLQRVRDVLASHKFLIVDIDSTIICQAPKIAPYRELMRERIASCLGIELSAVGIKATTTEGLGFTGRQEGIAALASVLLTTQ